jgi:addiction module HigA family antidote
MAMKHPPHPGRMLRADIEALELTVAEAASGLGVTRQQLYNVLNGKSSITPDMAFRLEQGIGSSADTWLRLQNAYDLAQVRARSEEINVKRLVPKHAHLSQ